MTILAKIMSRIMLKKIFMNTVLYHTASVDTAYICFAISAIFSWFLTMLSKGKATHTLLKGFWPNFHISFVIMFPRAYCRCFAIQTFFFCELLPLITFISWKPGFVVLQHFLFFLLLTYCHNWYTCTYIDIGIRPSL